MQGTIVAGRMDDHHCKRSSSRHSPASLCLSRSLSLLGRTTVRRGPLMKRKHRESQKGRVKPRSVVIFTRFCAQNWGVRWSERKIFFCGVLRDCVPGYIILFSLLCVCVPPRSIFSSRKEKKGKKGVFHYTVQ